MHAVLRLAVCCLMSRKAINDSMTLPGGFKSVHLAVFSMPSYEGGMNQTAE